jgi:hypothetical protein
MKARYATEQDLRSWFEGAVPTTMRAVVIDDDGRILGVAGIARTDDHMQCFSKITDELRPHKITMGRAAAMIRSMLKDAGPVWAVCSPTEPTAPHLLKWCGFKHVQEGVWCHGGL